MRDNMLEFSSTVLSTLSPYLVRFPLVKIELKSRAKSIKHLSNNVAVPRNSKKVHKIIVSMELENSSTKVHL